LKQINVTKLKQIDICGY